MRRLRWLFPRPRLCFSTVPHDNSIVDNYRFYCDHFFCYYWHVRLKHEKTKSIPRLLQPSRQKVNWRLVDLLPMVSLPSRAFHPELLLLSVPSSVPISQKKKKRMLPTIGAGNRRAPLSSLPGGPESLRECLSDGGVTLRRPCTSVRSFPGGLSPARAGAGDGANCAAGRAASLPFSREETQKEKWSVLRRNLDAKQEPWAIFGGRKIVPVMSTNGLLSIKSVASSAQTHAVESPEDVVAPTEEFRHNALVPSKEKYLSLYNRSITDPDVFWGEIASEFYWKTKWKAEDGKVHKENFDVRQGPIHVEWFKGGQTNICYNAVDKHVDAGRGNDVALLWEGNEPGYDSSLTFSQLRDLVSQLANYLRSLGVRKGDAVIVYMPMLVELPVAMLACARIGAIHSVVFAGFSSESLAQRILDCKPKVVLTASGVMRGAKLIRLKDIVDDALVKASESGFSAGTVLVYDNDIALAKKDTAWETGRDVWWQDVVPKQDTESPVEWVDAEDPLFLLYTSGSTGKPKGVLHTTGGYMIWTATTFKYAFNYHAGEIFWCTADCGWITGHSYLTYGPLLNGATVVVFEGVPNYPDEGRCWEIVDKYKVNIFYTAPTAIRSLMRAGDKPVRKHSRASLKVLGSVGEPINPAAWRWYYDVVGDGRCPISDTWWQTETGGFMITPIPGAFPLKPGSATFPFFGVQPAIVDENGKELQGECSGYLCIKSAWPGTFRTLYGDHARYETTYYAPFKGFYFSGDGCYRDKDGYYWLTGRVDDVINVSGHRIGSAEVESALVSHPQAAEAAVVGFDHQVKGQGIYAFVTLVEGVDYSEELRRQLVATVRSKIGPFAAPDKIHWAPGLPKTRSGKIMRRILRKIASNEIDQLGDISTLADPGVVDQLIALKDK